MIKIHNEGITKYINENDWQRYRELGFKRVETKDVETPKEIKKGKKAE